MNNSINTIVQQYKNTHELILGHRNGFYYNLGIECAIEGIPREDTLVYFWTHFQAEDFDDHDITLILNKAFDKVQNVDVNTINGNMDDVANYNDYFELQNQDPIDIEKFRIKSSDPIPEDVYIMSIADIPICSFGGISLLIGKKKSRKTHLLSLIIGIAATNGVRHEIRFSFPDDKDKIVLIDTEQTRIETYQTIQKIRHVSGLKKDDFDNKVYVYHLRTLSPDERTAALDQIAEMHDNIGMIVIDGIRDLIHDINKPEQANAILSKLLKISEEKAIHIMCVLHQNKNDFNARGHLGTELENKSQYILILENKGEFSVVSGEGRQKPFSPFSISHGDSGVPEISNVDIQKSNIKRDKWSVYQYSDKDLEGLVGNVFGNGEPVKYKESWEKIKKYFNLADNKSKEVLKFLQDTGRVIKEDGVYKKTDPGQGKPEEPADWF